MVNIGKMSTELGLEGSDEPHVSVTCFCSHGNVAHGMETIFLYIHAEMIISRTPWAPEGNDFTGNIDE